MTLLTIAFKNLRGNMVRSLSLFLVMFVLAGTLLTITLLHAGLTLSLERSRQRLGADIMVVPSGHSGEAREIFLVGSAGSFTMPGAASFPADVVRSYEGVAAVSPQLFAVSAPLPCCSVADTMIVGFDPETDFVITPWVRERAGTRGRNYEERVRLDMQYIRNWNIWQDIHILLATIPAVFSRKGAY